MKLEVLRYILLEIISSPHKFSAKNNGKKAYQLPEKKYADLKKKKKIIDPKIINQVSKSKTLLR